MYKQTSRFRQTLAQNGRTLTGRDPALRKRAGKPTSALSQRLDKEAKRASTTPPRQDRKPQLVKRPRRADPSN